MPEIDNGTVGAPVEQIALTADVIKLLGADKVAELQNKIKAAANSREQLENIIPAFTTAVEAFTKACTEFTNAKTLEAESDKFDEISTSKALAALKALPDDNPTKQATIRGLLGEFGAREVELVLEGNEFAKNLSRPLKANHKNAEKLGDLRKGWDYFMTLMACMKGGITEASTADKAWAGDWVKYDKANAAIAVARLKAAGAPGMDMVGEAVEKALNTQTTGSGLEWLPTILSNDLVTTIFASLRLANLFPRYTMASKSLYLPTQYGNTRAFVMDENINDTGRGQNTPFWQNFATPSGISTGQIHFLARKLAVMTFFSDEIEQDSFLPVLDIIQNNIVQFGMGMSLEDMLLNGTYGLSTTDLRKYMDNGAANAGDRLWSEGDGPYDARAFMDGLRFMFYKQGTAPIDGSVTDSWREEGLDIMRNARKDLGKWGATGDEQSNLVWIAGLATHVELLKIKEVLTMDKFGPNATILSGQIGSIDGIPIILSQFVPTNLNNLGTFSNGTATTYTSDNGAYLSGLTSDTSSNKTAMYLLNRRVFAWGDRQAVRVESERQILSGQRYVIATWRGDGKRIYPNSEPLISMVRNMAI